MRQGLGRQCGILGLVTMSNDKVVVIEGGESGSHAVAVYKFNLIPKRGVYYASYW